MPIRGSTHVRVLMIPIVTMDECLGFHHLIHFQVNQRFNSTFNPHKMQISHYLQKYSRVNRLAMIQPLLLLYEITQSLFGTRQTEIGKSVFESFSIPTLYSRIIITARIFHKALISFCIKIKALAQQKHKSPKLGIII